MRLALAVLVTSMTACSGSDATPTDGGTDAAELPAGRCAGQSGPDCLLQMTAVTDVSTLGLALDGPLQMASEGSVSLVEVPFRFTGVPWHGMTWTHRASLFLPLPAPAGGWTSVAVYAEYVDPGTDTPPEAIKEFAGRQIAAATGVPVAVIASLPPNPITLDGSAPDAAALTAAHPELARCFGQPLEESDFQQCLDALVTGARDLDWLMAPLLARGYLRAVLALKQLDPVLHADSAGASLAAFKPTSIGTGGYSKRGIAQWLVGGSDPSVKAIWVGSGERPDLRTYAQLKYDQWGDQSRVTEPPSFYDTPFGQEYLAQTDPAAWPTRLAAVKISAIRGTNDEIWPFGLFEHYPAMFPSLDHVGFLADASHLYTANGGLTLASTELLASWQGFVSRLAGNEPAPRITATFNLDANPISVSATVTGATAPALRVWWVDHLHCTKPMDSQYAHYNVWGKDDVDMRDVAWTSMPLTGANGAFSGTLPVGKAALPLHGQIFVDVLDGNRFASTIPVAVGGGTDRSCP